MKDLHIHVLDARSTQALKVASWQITNPAYAPRNAAPAWVPERIPQTQRIGDTEVRLRDLRWSSMSRDTCALYFDSFKPQNLVQGYYHYEPVLASLFDGTGNAISGRPTHAGQVYFHQVELEREVPAWRAQVTFASTDLTDTNGLWQLTVPGINGKKARFKRRFNGVDVTLTGPMQTAYGNGYTLRLGRPDSLFVSVRSLTDGQGRLEAPMFRLDYLSRTEALMVAQPWWPTFTTNTTFKLVLNLRKATVLNFDFAPTSSDF